MVPFAPATGFGPNFSTESPQAVCPSQGPFPVVTYTFPSLSATGPPPPIHIPPALAKPPSPLKFGLAWNTPTCARVEALYASSHPLWQPPSPMYTLPLANSKAARCRHDVSSVCTPLTESELVAATEALMLTGPPNFCAPVVTLRALSRNVPPTELDSSVETTYSVPEVGSIT